MKRFASIAILLMLAGCGYRPLGQGEVSNLPMTVKTIAIGQLKNRTLRPTIQPALKEALIGRFAADARIRVVEEGVADAILEGAIEGFGEDPIAFDAADITRRLRVSISFSFIVKDRMKDTVFLRDGVTGVAYFSAGPGIGPTRTAEDEATSRALTDLAGQVVNRVMDGI